MAHEATGSAPTESGSDRASLEEGVVLPFPGRTFPLRSEVPTNPESR